MSNEKKIDGRSKEARALRAAGVDSMTDLSGQRPSLNAAVVNADRPTRKKTAGDLDVLTALNLPDGYVGRWVNDINVGGVDQIQRRLDLGYQFVNDGLVIVGDATTSTTRRPSMIKSMIVGKRNDGRDLEAYLMVQRKEWYDEDQNIKSHAVDKTVEDLEKDEKEQERYGKGLQIGRM